MNDWLTQVPPWQAFPDMAPEDAGARQGAQEAWVDQVWRPFWAGLSPTQRDAYLAHWNASDAWRHAIRSTFEPSPGFDAGADAAESEAWLRARAGSSTTHANSTLASRLARWIRGR